MTNYKDNIALWAKAGSDVCTDPYVLELLSRVEALEKAQKQTSKKLKQQLK
jgi:hypothetical protein